MARADLILNLIRAGRQGDQVQFRKIVEELAAEERSKKHTIFADRILSYLQVSNGRFGSLPASSTRPSSGPLVAQVSPVRSLDDLILPPDVRETIGDLIEEQNRADLLRAYNLEPRNRVLLAGPPGNGKTALAEALATSLNLPLLIVRYESIIGSYLGETAQRIEQVFQHARSHHCVLFFDEFDAVGKERGDLHETGEIKRVVTSLLLQIDALPSYVIVVAASNHPELLDRAVWRRFQIRLELPMPRQGQIEEWFRQFENRTGYILGVSPRSLARSLLGLSFAEVEDFGSDLARKIVLSKPDESIERIVESRLRSWKGRFSVKDQTGAGRTA